MRHKAPTHLSQDAQKFWTDVQKDFSIIDPCGLALLSQAAECLDRAAAARAEIAATGTQYVDRFGAPRTAPAVATERNSQLTFCRLIKTLGLDLEPPKGGR